MDYIFLLLTILSLVGLVIGLGKPEKVRLPSRKIVGWTFGGAAFIFFIMVGVTAPATPVSTNVTTTAATTTSAADVQNMSQPQTVAGTEQPAAAPAQTPAEEQQADDG